jgi:hypothetical protein
MDLKKFEKNIQSQCGEDGILEEVFNRIGITNKICVEFGAWDGIYLSNTCCLWKEKNWRAILIEGDKERYDILVKNTKEYSNVIAVNKYISFDGENSLDRILSTLNLPREIDILSIDIDGDDYYIYENLIDFIPRVIVIEYNRTIPPHIDVVQERGNGCFGASALAILKLAHFKGYKIAHLTESNMIFVINSEYSKLNIPEPDIDRIFPYKSLSYLFSSFNGDIVASSLPAFMSKTYYEDIFFSLNTYDNNLFVEEPGRTFYNLRKYKNNYELVWHIVKNKIKRTFLCTGWRKYLKRKDYKFF